jgi:hypothetical protein
VNQRTTIYREDTGKKDQGKAFLARGFASTTPDEDSPAIVAVVTPAVDENGGACKTHK